MKLLLAKILAAVLSSLLLLVIVLFMAVGAFLGLWQQVHYDVLETVDRRSQRRRPKP